MRLKTEHEKAESLLKGEEKKSSGQSGDLVTLLEQAKSFVDATMLLGECPVCEQTVNRDNLSASLKDRIGGMRKIAELSQAVATAKKKLDGKSATVTTEKVKYAKQIELVADKLRVSKLNSVLVAKFPIGLVDVLSNPETNEDDRVTKASEWDQILTTINIGLENESREWRESTTRHGFIARDLDNLRKYQKPLGNTIQSTFHNRHGAKPAYSVYRDAGGDA